MHIAIDSEFIEDGVTIKPISIALVREDGAEAYFEFPDVDWTKASPWVIENVKPHLKGVSTPLDLMRAKIQAFVGEKPKFWGYYADYDWVLFCQIFGKMIDLPKGFPMYCRDLKELMNDRKVEKDALPTQDGAEHNALDDARWIIKSVLHLTLEHKLETMVHEFTTAMKAKLQKKANEGRDGWDSPDWTPKMIRKALDEHIETGDPIDIANYCAFLWHRQPK